MRKLLMLLIILNVAICRLWRIVIGNRMSIWWMDHVVMPIDNMWWDRYYPNWKNQK